jgi:multiple sugar transport system ATP-binding protein
MAEVKLVDVVKRFGDVVAVDHISLEVHDKEFLVLVGPSGCGKSTTLQMVAGIEDLSDGEIYINDRLVNDVRPKDRDIAMVFQNYALYPHMTVFKNMAFCLKMKNYEKAEINQRVGEAAKILDLEELLDRRPKELSGGQRQRVAMGRAIVRKPQVFLFDEPLSNLDAKLRVHMRWELARLHRSLETTIIYVTHDQVEAMTLASRIVIMDQGRIMQEGAPMEVYNTPGNRFVAGFIGSPTMNFIDVTPELEHDELIIPIAGQKLVVPEPLKKRYESSIGKEVVLGIRPEHIYDLELKEEFPGASCVDAVVEVVEPVGASIILLSTLQTTPITACVDPASQVDPGMTKRLLLDMNKMHLFDKTTGDAL